MNRRDTVFGLLALGAALGPLAAQAQRRTGTPARIGFMSPFSLASGKQLIDCFRSGLQDLGWIEGNTITIEYRWAEGIPSRFPVLAEELVRSQPDLIVVASTPGTQAMQRATHTIPVVMLGVSDPVASGIVSSLARPGRNITGVSNFLPATSGKLIELLKTAAPKISRLGVLHNPSNAGKILEVQELQKAAQSTGVIILPLEVRTASDFGAAFSIAAQLKCDALITLQESVTLGGKMQIAEFAKKNRLPTIYQIREFVEAGGLMSYGLNYCYHFQRAAYYVDKILKGAKPGDLPVELPSTFELVINIKTAKALGLTIPQSMLARADEVIP